MGRRATPEYLAPFYVPTLRKWVVMERMAIELIRRGRSGVPLHLFDERSIADKFYRDVMIGTVMPVRHESTH